MHAEFWQGKKVFLTGHTGFKGSWMTLWLRSLGAQVTGCALDPPTDPSLFELAQVADGIDDIRADIRDPERLSIALQAAGPDIVFHLAAQSLVRYSYQHSAETFATNVMGTVHLLDAVRECGSVRAVVIVTSDKCYENRGWHWGYREDEPMGGDDPYSASKGCAELVTASYRRSFFEGCETALVASARAGNVIGGGDFARDRLLTDIMAGLRAGTSIPIRNPNAIRPWQHVLEPLKGYLTLAQALFEHGSRYASGWNFGPADEDAKPVKWICDRLVTQWGKGASWQIDAAEHPAEATYLKLDASRARAELGWFPRLTVADALDWTIEWHRALDEGRDVRSLTLEQIEQYESLEASG